MEIIRIGAIGVTGVLLAVCFKTVKAEYGIFIGIVTGLIVFWHTVQNLALFMDEIRTLRVLAGADGGFLAILLKVAGIAYICEFCAGICKDAGYSAVGGQIEIFGKVMVLLTGLPILLSVIETIQNFGS